MKVSEDGHYWGIRNILLRLGYTPGTHSSVFHRYVRDCALPVQLRKDKHRPVYYTNENWLQLWEISEIKKSRRTVLKRASLRESNTR